MGLVCSIIKKKHFEIRNITSVLNHCLHSSKCTMTQQSYILFQGNSRPIRVYQGGAVACHALQLLVVFSLSSFCFVSYNSFCQIATLKNSISSYNVAGCKRNETLSLRSTPSVKPETKEVSEVATYKQLIPEAAIIRPRNPMLSLTISLSKLTAKCSSGCLYWLPWSLTDCYDGDH